MLLKLVYMRDVSLMTGLYVFNLLGNSRLGFLFSVSFPFRYHKASGKRRYLTSIVSIIDGFFRHKCRKVCLFGKLFSRIYNYVRGHPSRPQNFKYLSTCGGVRKEALQPFSHGKLTEKKFVGVLLRKSWTNKHEKNYVAKIRLALRVNNKISPPVLQGAIRGICFNF